MTMGHGPIVTDSISARRNLRNNSYTYLIDKATQRPLVDQLLWTDVETDPSGAWFCIFIAYPRITSPYVSTRIGNTPPHPTLDDGMNKLADADIRAILNYGFAETRTQWFHTSVEFGTVWADGSLTNNSTYYNLFEFPDNWNSTSASAGQRFKRKRGLDLNYTDWIVSGSTSGCSSAVGGWSNHYEQSCVVSWFAGCEGGPAWNHRCAGNVQDRANKLIIWAR